MRHAKHFNLIEILLTVAVIAFGVSVILGMLPRGLLMTREAGVESYASEIIDQMAGFFFTEPNAVLGLPGTAPDITDAIDSSVMSNYSGLLKYMDLTPVQSPESDYFTGTGTSGVFRRASGVYVIVMGDAYDDGDGETETRVDFSGMLRVWQETPSVHIVALNADAISSETGEGDEHFPNLRADVTGGADFSAIAASSPGVVRVCMELSYPLSRPYNQRTKRYYSFEVKQ